MSSHTSAPWTLRHGHIVKIGVRSVTVLANVYQPTQGDELGANANACLIAAAPDLLEALMPFVALLQEHNDRGKDDTPVFGINHARITVGDLRRARAAVHKVIGKDIDK
jgi:hypothetical protein